MLRNLVIGRIGSAGDKSVIGEANKRFAAHCDGSAELPADLRSAVSFDTVMDVQQYAMRLDFCMREKLVADQIHDVKHVVITGTRLAPSVLLKQSGPAKVKPHYIFAGNK